MIELLTGFIRRASSRKFIVAAAAYSIVLLDGLGYAEFDAEVTIIASGALITYIGAEGATDLVGRNRS